VDRRKRRWIVRVVAVLFVAAPLVVVAWPRVCDWYRPPHVDLPDPSELVEMKAVAWESGSRGYFETGVPEFDVPKAQIVRIWRRFEPNEYEPSPPIDRDLPLGKLTATTADGRVTRLRFYETGGSDLIFTTDGKHFFRSEPKDDYGYPLGGGIPLVGTLRQVSSRAFGSGR
jgi:hypothetical protein